MEGTRIEQAVGRIEAALGRIEAAAGRLSDDSAGSGAASDLARRHEALRSEVRASLTELDRIIEGLET